MPDRTQVVRYADYQVNIMAAVLMMPRNATYLFDLTEGGVEILYAVEIGGSFNGVPIQAILVRDRISKKFSICSNARIQNVFGGVQPANFIANSHMESTCRGGQKRITADEVEQVVFRQLAVKVARIPGVNKVVRANQQ